MNWISAITNPKSKIIRKATNFSGSILNIYPWPVSSVVTRIKLVDGAGASGASSLTTGPLLGTQIAALANVYAYPVRVAMTSPDTNGEYNNADGVNVVNPSNMPYLRIDFGRHIGPSDIYIEGYEVGSQYLQLNDQTRSINTRFNRILLGSATAITSFFKKATPISFGTVTANDVIAGLDSVPGTFSLTGTTHVYLASNSTFSGFQINLNSEGYTRTKPYTIEYWNGTTWTGAAGIYSTTSQTNDTNLVFNQSGVVTFTKPSDWAQRTITGDPQFGTLANAASGSGNYAYSNSQYFLRIVPPSPNAESIAVESIALFD